MWIDCCRDEESSHKLGSLLRQRYCMLHGRRHPVPGRRNSKNYPHRAPRRNRNSIHLPRHSRIVPYTPGSSGHNRCRAMPDNPTYFLQRAPRLVEHRTCQRQSRVDWIDTSMFHTSACRYRHCSTRNNCPLFCPPIRNSDNLRPLCRCQTSR